MALEKKKRQGGPDRSREKLAGSPEFYLFIVWHKMK
jgi:hypothetical protein